MDEYVTEKQRALMRDFELADYYHIYVEPVNPNVKFKIQNTDIPVPERNSVPWSTVSVTEEYMEKLLEEVWDSGWLYRGSLNWREGNCIFTLEIY